MVIEEIMIGAVLGLTARLTISALEVAGSVIAQQLGLGFVTAVDPSQGEQSMIVGNFLTMLAITLFFATDMHYLVLAALNDSYTLFAPGEVPSTGDVAALVTKTVSGAFRIGIQLSAPFLVFGLLFNLGLGVLSRLMPAMQVYFLALPVSILLGFLFLVLVLGSMMGMFLDYAPACCTRSRRTHEHAGNGLQAADGRRTRTTPNKQKTRHRGGSNRPSSAATSSKASKSRPGS